MSIANMFIILILCVFSSDAVDAGSYFPFISMSVLLEVEQIFLPATDDGVLGPLDISVGFPFGNSNQTQVYVRRTQ